MAEPALSSIFLSWNRADLLKVTLESYSATIEAPHEVFVVDNGSTDESRDVIRGFAERHPGVVSLLQPANEGGAALNHAIERATGRLIHLSENDIEYLPGWDATVLGLFDKFPQLGQLSPFGPVPEDPEVWVAKPCVLRPSAGAFLYEAFGNLGTTCFLRRELTDRGLRVHNLERRGTFLFPDDIRLSREVKEAGFLTAFAPHYLVHNLGHWGEEFERRDEYYRQNYESKPVGEEQWRARVAEWRKRAIPQRRSTLLPREPVSPEKTDPSEDCPEPWLWTMFDGWTAEVETVEFLHALIRLTKPRFALETGTWRGVAAEAMGRALQTNGRGRLVTLEVDPENHRVAAERIRAARLESHVVLVLGSSIEYEPPDPIDFALFDSDLSLRLPEFRRFEPYLVPGAVVLFHDTSSGHRVVREAVTELRREGVLEGFFLATPRGLAVCRYLGPRSG